MNKKAVFIVLFLIVLISSFILIISSQKKEIIEPILITDSSQVVPSDSSLGCFNYDQSATDSEPYSVSETIKITINNGIVSGTKTGTQFGPDMSNGYEGSIQGTISGTEITSLFNYIIEGSDGVEQELYTLSSNKFIKHRYQLVESGNMLVPDLKTEKRDIVYIKTTCNE
jgi:hypothetical protein